MTSIHHEDTDSFDDAAPTILTPYAGEEHQAITRDFCAGGNPPFWAMKGHIWRAWLTPDTYHLPHLARDVPHELQSQLNAELEKKLRRVKHPWERRYVEKVHARNTKKAIVEMRR